MNGEYYLNFKSKQQEFDPNDPTSIIAGIVIFGGFSLLSHTVGIGLNYGTSKRNRITQNG